MSNHDTDRLSQALRQRSGDMAGTHVDLEDVRGRARRIRGRRRATGVAVAAVLLAVGAPLGLNLDSLGRSQPIAPANQPSAPAPAPTATAGGPEPSPRLDGTFPLTLDGLPVGAAPALPFVLADQRQLVTAEQTYDLPVAFLQVIPFRGGWLGIAERTTGAGGLELWFMDADFTATRSANTGPSFVLNPDGSRVAYTERDQNRTWLVNASTTTDDERRHELTGEGDLQPVGFLADDTLVFQNTSGQTQKPAVQTPDEAYRVDGLINARGVSPSGLVAGLVSWTVDSSCSALVAAETGAPVWRTCDHTLGAFSPDGRYVLGYPTQNDGPGPSSLTVLDAASGEPVTTFRPDRTREVVGISQAVWEDNDSLLVTLTAGSRLGMLRADVDGRLAVVTDTVDASDTTVAMWFAGQSRI